VPCLCLRVPRQSLSLSARRFGRYRCLSLSVASLIHRERRAAPPRSESWRALSFPCCCLSAGLQSCLRRQNHHPPSLAPARRAPPPNAQRPTAQGKASTHWHWLASAAVGQRALCLFGSCCSSRSRSLCCCWCTDHSVCVSRVCRRSCSCCFSVNALHYSLITLPPFAIHSALRHSPRIRRAAQHRPFPCKGRKAARALPFPQRQHFDGVSREASQEPRARGSATTTTDASHPCQLR
jgi:hypothetical protein